MRRYSAGWCAFLAIIGLACQSAEADDLKSATRVARAVLVAPAPAAAVPANDGAQSVTVGLFENGASFSAARESKRETEKPPHERKVITLFHFNSQFGDVAVQPVFGRINGAQLSLGF